MKWLVLALIAIISGVVMMWLWDRGRTDDVGALFLMMGMTTNFMISDAHITAQHEQDAKDSVMTAKDWDM